MSKSSKEENADNREKKKRISMHEDIPIWHDCCSCEAEPYWVEAFEKSEKQVHKMGSTGTRNRVPPQNANATNVVPPKNAIARRKTAC